MQKLLTAFWSVGLVLMLGVAGCEKKDGGDAGEGVEVEVEVDGVAGEEAVTGADVGRDLSEALGTAGEYASQKQEALVVAAGEKLAEMDDDIERLKEKGAELSGVAKTKWEQMKIDLEVKAAAAKEELAKAKVAGAAALSEASVELSRAMEEVGDAYEEAAKDFEKALESPEPASPIQP